MHTVCDGWSWCQSHLGNSIQKDQSFDYNFLNKEEEEPPKSFSDPGHGKRAPAWERCDGETRKTKMQKAQFEEGRVTASKNAIEESKGRWDWKTGISSKKSPENCTRAVSERLMWQKPDFSGPRGKEHKDGYIKCRQFFQEVLTVYVPRAFKCCWALT